MSRPEVDHERQNALLSTASVLADVLAPVVQLANQVGHTIMRLVRLAQLRAVTRGTVPVNTQFDGPVHTAGPTRLTLGAHCRLGRDTFLETAGTGRIEIGTHVRLNMGTVLVAYDRIRIGDDCLIGEYVSIRDANHGTAVGQPMRLQPHTARPIVIGNDVWVARGAIILGGVTVGDGAVVAANSVVTKDVPAMTIVGGVPARVIRRRDDEEKVHETGNVENLK